MRIRLPLRTKENRHGQKYLFAALPMLDAILFIYPQTPDAEGNDYMLELKPYTGNGRRGPAGGPGHDERNGAGSPGDDDDFGAAWEGERRGAKPPFPRAA